MKVEPCIKLEDWTTKRIDVSKLDPEMLRTIYDVFSDKLVRDMTEEEKAEIRKKVDGMTLLEYFGAWLAFEGIIGYTSTIVNMMHRLHARAK